MSIKTETIAVIGAGVMGCDVALDLSFHGYRVYLKDINEGILQDAKVRITKNMKLFKLLKKEMLPVSMDELLSKISFTCNYSNFEKMDIVIENVTEDFDIKKAVYNELRKICREDVLYGVNTSCIPISRIADLLPRPENVIGIHFLNPAPLKNLVEIITTSSTSENTLERTKVFLKSIGKKWVVVNDSPGFVTNRVLMLTINECIALVQEKIAKPETIDTIFTQGFSHKMGPLSTADMIGLDTVRDSLNILYESFRDLKYKPCNLLIKMIEEGRLGKKTGKGFFEY